MSLLTFRKLADKSTGQRVKRYHPLTGEAYLVDPDDPIDPAVEAAVAGLPDQLQRVVLAAAASPKPWPLAGVEIVDPPEETTVSTTKVAEGVREGWCTLVDERLEHRPAGPESDPWRQTHTFRQAAEVVFHTVAGDIRYRVAEQPDKYEYEDGSISVDWFYRLERIDG